MEFSQIDECIQRVRAGDLDAYAQVVQETQDRLRAFILWFHPEASVVDDIAQEVYIFAYRNIDQYETGTEFLAWLRTIARYRILNRGRSVMARVQREERYADEVLLSAAAECEDVSEHQLDRLDMLRKCLEKLPQKSLEIIKRRYQEELNSDQLASALGKSATALRVTLMRIREQLRQCVETRLLSGEVAE